MTQQKHRTFRPLNRKTADAMIALINECVGRSDRVALLMTTSPPDVGNLGTNLETQEEMIQFMRTFFNKTTMTLMLERQKMGLNATAIADGSQ
jgi:hypothetical protein